MYYRVYQDGLKQWRWSLVAANYKIIAASGEGYHNKADCLYAISLVKGSSGAPIYEF